MSKRERAFAVLPTLLTLGNALCGFAAITYAARLGIEDVQAGDSHLLYASMCIFAGMVFDALDGRAARWANQSSEFGAQLDSLCDVVTFGVAPAFLMRQFSLQSVLHPRILWVIAGLYVACAILRLARFTIETDEEDSHDFFSGLPSPAAAGAVASFPVAMYGLGKLTVPSENVSVFARQIATWLEPAFLEVLPLITLAVACLMVSRIRYSHVFNQLFSGKRSRAHVIQVVFTGAVIFSVREMAVPLIFCYFAFASPCRALWKSMMVPKSQEQSSQETVRQR
ncbi:MAG: CDP-diacylglycerol--serine O-phosphatidyltransferase [Planctomycetota bacterium]|nr:CDP-diacylglycerol--serine O-phosphatidyltransferase [Planctomycetota bacterium]